MDKEYLTIDGELAMVDGKLIGVEGSANVSDVVDEQTTYVAQSQSLTNEIEELLVNGVIDGSPKGVYANLSALQTAYPNGASGVYLTSDTGHWYYYNNGWKDGGAYRESSNTIYTKFDTVTALDGATVSGTPKFLRYGKFYKFTSNLIIKGEWTLGGGYSGWSTPIAIATISGGNEALTTDELTYLNARFGVIGSGVLAKKAYIENGTIYISVLQAAGGTNTITEVYFMQRYWTIIDYPDPTPYPVGSIYMSTNSTSPAEIYGGQWEQIKDRFLLGASDNYSAGVPGGSASVTLTGDNLPNILQVGQNNSGVEKWISGCPWNNQPYADQAFIVTQKSYLNEVGNNYVYNQPHDNMPPYLAVYIWKRTA